MEPYLELINYIAPPAINIAPEVTTRRRLFGGDYPPDWVGHSFRIFGGHDYGYVIPRTAFNGDMNQINYWTRSNTYLGFATTAGLAIGNYILFGPWKSFKIFAFFLLVNEIYSYYLASNTKSITYQQLLDHYTNLERTVGLGLDAGKSPHELAQTRFMGLQRDELRFVSGSSMLYGALAGFAVAKSGLFPFESLWYPSRKAALSFGVGNAVVLNNIWMWFQEKQSGKKTGIAHDKHFLSMAFGYLFGYVNVLSNLLL